ncbi:Peptidoglycan-N-acetylglucosamine deacetylase [bioreactor metagenome]|uniref:Peptidoglycan-N-acetylglucosamine deacetylase n=1 Tax=bioreactor metagenome TaxID=1076179 RepID=A0A645AJH0_9ZZZZ|nr:polysaccharide deacetylase family protein [Paludibacter sp.]
MQFPVFLRPLFGRLTWRIKTKSRLIYLTFDDGPVPEVTPQVLDILDQYGWKATFFCVGENVKRHPELYEEIIHRGHRVGNHSYNHIRGFRFSVEDYVANVNKASEVIDSKLFRPPHGRIKFSQIKALRENYQIVMWDVITYDYDSRKSPDTIFGIVRRYLRKGSIVVFHDSIKAKKNVLTVLPKALGYWKEQNYEYGLL